MRPGLHLLAALLLAGAALSASAQTPIALPVLEHELQVGDLVFIRVHALPFAKVAEATNSWTNHVGVVTDTRGPEPEISESALPRSRRTSLARFVARSEGGRVAVMRLNATLTDAQREAVKQAATARMGVFYDTGFDLHSKHREFCSRFAREVLFEAAGAEVGEVETFAHLLQRNPSAGLGFWRVWYFGAIPWQRETVTPASQLQSTQLHPVFDGRVG